MPAKAGRLENRHSGARRRREPGIHSHNTIYDEATAIMDSGLLASLGPGMTRSHATSREGGHPVHTDSEMKHSLPNYLLCLPDHPLSRVMTGW